MKNAKQDFSFQRPCLAIFILGASVTVGAAGACGGGQTRGSPFDPAWVDDHGAAMASFVRSFSHRRLRPAADVAVGVIGKTTLVGVPLAAGERWTFEHELHGRPAVAGSVVVAAGGGEIFALDARTGKLLWARAAGGRIRGAGDDGKTTVVSLIPTIGSGSVVLAIARDGSVVRQLEDDAAIGVPAVADDTVFFPWNGRFLSVYDLPSGDERARVPWAGPISRAFTLGGAVFAGETSFTRIDEHLQSGANAVLLPAPLGGLLGGVRWTRPGTDWVNREAEPLDKIRLYARPTTSGPAGIEGGRFAATYYRVALGFDASSSTLVWAQPHDADFLGGAAYQGGVALCDASGTVLLIDATTGGVARRASLGRAVDACLVQADELTTPRAPSAKPLSEQLDHILRLPQPELAPVQRALRQVSVATRVDAG
jgi:outer membrane protein assembly factor BamB